MRKSVSSDSSGSAGFCHRAQAAHEGCYPERDSLAINGSYSTPGWPPDRQNRNSRVYSREPKSRGDFVKSEMSDERKLASLESEKMKFDEIGVMVPMRHILPGESIPAPEPLPTPSPSFLNR
jgi:hypothetical protein